MQAGREGKGILIMCLTKKVSHELQLLNNNNAISITILLYIIVCSICSMLILFFGYRLLMKGDGRWLVRMKQQMSLRLPGYTMHVGVPKGRKSHYEISLLCHHRMD